LFSLWYLRISKVSLSPLVPTLLPCSDSPRHSQHLKSQTLESWRCPEILPTVLPPFTKDSCSPTHRNYPLIHVHMSLKSSSVSHAYLWYRCVPGKARDVCSQFCIQGHCWQHKQRKYDFGSHLTWWFFIAPLIGQTDCFQVVLV